MELLDYAHSPYICIWEVTRACTLACRHCRAEANDVVDPRELSRSEGLALVQAVAAMGARVLVLTGGDPLQRVDLEDLIRTGKDAGLRMATIPASTERCSFQRIHSLARAGVDQLALSVDHADARFHDAFRGIRGAFHRAMNAATWIRAAGVPLQINTVLGPWNIDALDALVELVRRLQVAFWEVFFLVPTGRGRELDSLAPARIEAAFDRLYEVAAAREFVVKVAEAPHYHRYRLQRRLRVMQEEPDAARRPHGLVGRAPRPVNAGRGYCFVDHVGDVYPSGFLPVSAGNVRRSSVADLYRHSELFRALRDPGQLHGRCGHCEFRGICGGSRSRAYALTGDYLASDPACAYQPDPNGAPTVADPS